MSGIVTVAISPAGAVAEVLGLTMWVTVSGFLFIANNVVQYTNMEAPVPMGAVMVFVLLHRPANRMDKLVRNLEPLEVNVALLFVRQMGSAEQIPVRTPVLQEVQKNALVVMHRPATTMIIMFV